MILRRTDIPVCPWLVYKPWTDRNVRPTPGLLKLRMPAQQAAFPLEEFMQSVKGPNVSLDGSGVFVYWSNVKGTAGEMPADLHQLCFRHSFHYLCKAGGDRVDGPGLRMFVDPLLELSARQIG